jgi:hypothetical protein
MARAVECLFFWCVDLEYLVLLGRIDRKVFRFDSKSGLGDV